MLVVAVVARRSSSPSSSAAASVGKGGKFERVAYDGLGAWVDVFDYAPNYQNQGLSPPVTPQDLDAMAAFGVKTLYLQAARLDDRSPDGIVDADLIGQFLERAHANGIRVVGWYLPKFAALDADLARLRRSPTSSGRANVSTASPSTSRTPRTCRTWPSATSA